MFAVIKTGGKQYKVAENDEIIIEKLDAEAGDEVTFENVLILGADGQAMIGTPVVEGACVLGEVTDQRKGAKVMIMKKRQRSTYRRKKGHRQHETVVKITSILADATKATKKKAAKPKKADATPETVTQTAPPAAEPKKAPAAPAAAAPVAASDDLTKLKGLGKVFAGKLNGAGITSYAQLAALGADDIDKLEEELGAKGKFEKNDWVDQAASLAAAVE